MRTLIVVAVAWLSGCQCGDPCQPENGDAGAALRKQGEPCTDGFACAPGLTCSYTSSNPDFVERACVAPCGDAGQCAFGSACIDGEGRTTECHKRCTADSDCDSRFTMTCRPVDAGAVRGVCAARACQDTVDCLGGVCFSQEYCCPPGAPCAAPPPGFCVR